MEACPRRDERVNTKTVAPSCASIGEERWEGDRMAHGTQRKRRRDDRSNDGGNSQAEVCLASFQPRENIVLVEEMARNERSPRSENIMSRRSRRRRRGSRPDEVDGMERLFSPRASRRVHRRRRSRWREHHPSTPRACARACDRAHGHASRRDLLCIKVGWISLSDLRQKIGRTNG